MIVFKYQAAVEIFINQGGGLSIKQDGPMHQESGPAYISIQLDNVDAFIKAIRDLVDAQGK